MCIRDRDNINGPYSQNTMGFSSSSNINRVDFENHIGFSERRNVTYGESHDEERLMYKNLQYGATNGSYNVKTLATALERQKAYASVLFTVPGPKMIWEFGELGYDYGINRCTNGTYSTGCRTDPKPSAFDPSLNYFANTQRKAVYDVWAKILSLRMNNIVFNTKTFDVNSGDLLPRIYIWNDTLPVSYTHLDVYKRQFKELVDKFHQNGIAVILDIALNHATQRNPLVRLWNTDPDGDGYGVPNSSNPYFNTCLLYTSRCV